MKSEAIPGLGLGKIISASRRTDIPSFYARWFINRIREGYVIVRNPFNYKIQTRVSLLPQDVAAIVFWTRDAEPLIPFFPELNERNIPFAFLWTITGYSRSLEPNGVSLDHGIESFEKVAQIVGPNRIALRYDPIIITKKYNSQWHFNVITKLVNSLTGKTNRIIVSRLSPYRTVMSRLRKLIPDMLENPLDNEDVMHLFQEIVSLAAKNNLIIQSCCQNNELSELGITDGPCIDVDWLSKGLKIALKHTSDRGQREYCLCAKSLDIGSYDTCPRLCEYCYAFRSKRKTLNYFRLHDPARPSLDAFIL